MFMLTAKIWVQSFGSIPFRFLRIMDLIEKS